MTSMALSPSAFLVISRNCCGVRNCSILKHLVAQSMAVWMFLRASAGCSVVMLMASGLNLAISAHSAMPSCHDLVRFVTLTLTKSLVWYWHHRSSASLALPLDSPSSSSNFKNLSMQA